MYVVLLVQHLKITNDLYITINVKNLAIEIQIYGF